MRCWRISSNSKLGRSEGGPFDARAWAEDTKACFDREGPFEHLKRQVYSLQVRDVSISEYSQRGPSSTPRGPDAHYKSSTA